MDDPLGLQALHALADAMGDMVSGDGYYLDYKEVRQGCADWSAEKSYDEPTIWYFVEETEQDRGGERAIGSAFRTEDLVHFVVHQSSPPEANDLMDKLYRVRADLRKAALGDRSLGLGATSAHPNVYYEGTRFLFPEMKPEGMVGGTVEARFTIRWDDYPNG